VPAGEVDFRSLAKKEEAKAKEKIKIRMPFPQPGAAQIGKDQEIPAFAGMTATMLVFMSFRL